MSKQVPILTRHTHFRGLPVFVALIVSSLLYVPVAVAADSAQSISPDKAQFGGQCAEGLAEGKHVMTNCSVTWTGPDGKTYCFSSNEAKATFLKNPQQNLESALSFMAASNVQSTEQAMQNFDYKDAQTLVNGEIQAKLKANGGLYPFVDPLNGDHLNLAYDGIDFTRTIDGYGFFPDVKFHDPKNAKKKYLIDFWVTPVKGELQVQEVRIYKAPKLVDGEWRRFAREPIPWWWIPAQEHPGHFAQKRGWEVMSAIEQGALAQTKKDGGVFMLKDHKTGKTLHLEFVDTHQPVRQLDSNGHYFACTDFRVKGTKHQIYDIDFWVDSKDGKMSVNKIKVHKVPEFKDGHWVQVPRYSWKDLGNSHVVP